MYAIVQMPSIETLLIGGGGPVALNYYEGGCLLYSESYPSDDEAREAVRRIFPDATWTSGTRIDLTEYPHLVPDQVIHASGELEC